MKKVKPVQKAIRFIGASDTKPKTSKRDFGHHDFGRRNFDYPFGVQNAGYGHGFDWRYAIPPSPFGYFNYPNMNPMGFGPQQFGANFSGFSKGKRGRDQSSDSSDASTDDANRFFCHRTKVCVH